MDSNRVTQGGGQVAFRQSIPLPRAPMPGRCSAHGEAGQGALIQCHRAVCGAHGDEKPGCGSVFWYGLTAELGTSCLTFLGLNILLTCQTDVHHHARPSLLHSSRESLNSFPMHTYICMRAHTHSCTPTERPTYVHHRCGCMCVHTHL